MIHSGAKKGATEQVFHLDGFEKTSQKKWVSFSLNQQVNHEESYHLFVSLRVTHEYIVAVQTHCKTFV